LTNARGCSKIDPMLIRGIRPRREKTLRRCLACLAALTLPLAASPARAQSRFVHSHGTALALGSAPWTPRGVNLGNWFVPEAYMMGGGSSSEQVRLAFLALAGSPAQYQAWRAAYLSSYVTPQDIQRIKALGFNTVRVPLDWRDFVDPNGGAVETGLYGGPLPPDAPFGLRYLDRLLDWCRAAGVYVLPDMHVTPGTAADDAGEIYVASPAQDNPRLDAVKAAWQTIAGRYKNAANILGYDLLNEPPGYLNDKYRPTYQQIRDAIRQRDAHHLLVLESNVYADLGDTVHGDGYLGTPLDANMAVSIHSYGGDALPPSGIDADAPGGASADNSRAYYAWEYADKENVPVIIGETGENNNGWVNAVVHLWAVGKAARSAGGIRGAAITAGVLYWTYKKPGDAVRSVVSVPFAPGWGAIRDYLSHGGAAPADAFGLLMSQADISGYAHETFHVDVADSLLRDYAVGAPKPFRVAVPSIPGLVPAAGFDMGLAATPATPADYGPFAYHSANPQTVTHQVRNDRVGTYRRDSVSAVGSNSAGDWQNYTVSAAPGTYQVFLDYSAPADGPQVGLALNNRPLLATPALPGTGGYRSFHEALIGTALVTARGRATLRVTTVRAGLDYASFRFVPTQKSIQK